MPLELQRQFMLMRELDERSYKLQTEVDADMLHQLKAAAEKQGGLLTQSQGSRRLHGTPARAQRRPQGRLRRGCAPAAACRCLRAGWAD